MLLVKMFAVICLIMATSSQVFSQNQGDVPDSIKQRWAQNDNPEVKEKTGVTKEVTETGSLSTGPTTSTSYTSTSYTTDVSTTEKVTTSERLPFPNESMAINVFGGTTLDNASGLASQTTGIFLRLRQSTKNDRSYFGAGAMFMKAAYKDDHSFVYDTRFGVGPSFSFGRENGWTDIDVQYQRINRKGEVRHTTITWEEKMSLIDASLIMDFRTKFVGGFSLARTKLYLEYIYPLPGEKTISINGVPGQKEEASNVKSSYAKLELTWYNKRLGKSWAGTAFFLVGYDHQSWNVSDNYTVGAGVRFYKSDLEVLTLSFENRFRSSGSSSGEPRVNGCFNLMPVIKSIF